MLNYGDRENVTKQFWKNLLELEEKVGDAGAYGPFIRRTIAKQKSAFYRETGARSVQEVGKLKYVELKIRFDFSAQMNKVIFLNLIILRFFTGI